MSTDITQPMSKISFGKDKEVISLTPDNTIADLSVYMDVNKIRHIPVVKSQEDKKLLCMISKTELRKEQTPPIKHLPLKDLKDAGLSLVTLNQTVLETGEATIQNIFGDKFGIPLSEQTVIYDGDSLEEAFIKLSERDERQERYRTLPIISGNGEIVKGTCSYTDLLRVILNDPANNTFLNQSIKNIQCMTSRSNVHSLPLSGSITTAINALNSLQHTHFPLRQSNDTQDYHIDGFIDDVIIRTYEHKLLLPLLPKAKIDLIKIAKLFGKEGLVGEHNVVKTDVNIKEVIDKFVSGEHRPTAILVGNLGSKGDGQITCAMDGIISYVDIFRRFLDFCRTQD